MDVPSFGGLYLVFLTACLRSDCQKVFNCFPTEVETQSYDIIDGDAITVQFFCPSPHCFFG